MYYNFEINKCLNKKYENQSCLSSRECLNSMKCKENICQCEPGQHFDQTDLTCLDNTLINTPCISKRTCNYLLGLSCQNFLCKCDSNTQYWSSKQNKCVNLLSYNATGCHSNDQCFTNLTCVSETCECLKEFYWNSTYCIQTGDVWSKCDFDYQCRNYLVCLDKISACSRQFFITSFLKSNSGFSKFSFLNYYSIIFKIFLMIFIASFSNGLLFF